MKKSKKKPAIMNKRSAGFYKIKHTSHSMGRIVFRFNCTFQMCNQISVIGHQFSITIFDVSAWMLFYRKILKHRNCNITLRNRVVTVCKHSRSYCRSCLLWTHIHNTYLFIGWKFASLSYLFFKKVKCLYFFTKNKEFFFFLFLNIIQKIFSYRSENETYFLGWSLKRFFKNKPLSFRISAHKNRTLLSKKTKNYSLPQ